MKLIKVTKSVGLVAAIAAGCFLLFSMYVYEKTTEGIPPGPPLQMSRIDFSESVDSTLAAQVRSKVKHLEGVQHTYFNYEDGILVFSHDPKVQKADSVVEIVNEDFNLNGTRFVVTDEMASGGCPVTGTNTVFMRVGGYISSLF
jgi:hypothetical protein